jgi:hypothetical protein
MMGMREKLIEVLENDDCPLLYVLGENVGSLADYLIANGVTIQKWIPVSERLPEDDSDVLAYLRIGEEGRIYPANYAKGMWFDCIFNTPATNTTTHWMPLPEPPGVSE